MSLATLFDYDSLDVETRIVVQQKTNEIKERVRRTRQDIIEIGERLIDIKARLGHGRFGEWLKVEFEWTERSARRFIDVAEVFKSDIMSDLDITPTAMQSLASPSVPEDARKEAIQEASNGKHVGTKEAKQIIDKHKPEPTRAAPEPELFEDDDEGEESESDESEEEETEEETQEE